VGDFDKKINPQNKYMRGIKQVSFSTFYSEYKEVTSRNTLVSYRHIRSLFIDIVATSVEALTAVDHSQSLDGKMMHPADLAITSPPLRRLHQFGSIDL
jgi:hypothetical protein